jgi:hypothetical protein
MLSFFKRWNLFATLVLNIVLVQFGDGKYFFVRKLYQETGVYVHTQK